MGVPTLLGLYFKVLIVLLTMATESWMVLLDFQFPPMKSLFRAKNCLMLKFLSIDTFYRRIAS